MTWQPKASQSARAFRLFLESMDVIEESLCFPPNPNVEHMGRVARRVSVELRKLLFDRKPLLQAVLNQPRLHPLKDRKSLTGDTYQNERTVSIALGTSVGPSLGDVASHKWHIKVHPLHGLRFDNPEKKWEFNPMFDDGAAPITVDRWLRQRLFCVDNREYSLFDTLKFIANKEAAHVDTDNDILSEDMERVHFGHTTYYHIVAILTAAYLSDQHGAGQQANRSEWERFFSYRPYRAPRPDALRGGTLLGAEIDPMGLPNVFRESGIPIPVPGESWNPVQMEESAVVYP